MIQKVSFSRRSHVLGSNLTVRDIHYVTESAMRRTQIIDIVLRIRIEA